VAGLTHTPTGGWMAREMMAELRRAHAAAAAITAEAAGTATAETAAEAGEAEGAAEAVEEAAGAEGAAGTEQVAADEAAEAAEAEEATASSGGARAPPWQQLAAATAALAAQVEEEKPLPSVDIGKLTGARGARVPTTPTPPGYRDLLANRDGPLGCYYVMPTGQGGQPDDAYRLPVIAAEEMALASIAEGGGRAAEGELRRIAREGCGGEGWPILGRPRPVTLPVSTLGLRNDPVGAVKWARMWQLAEEVASGVGVRLLCHCRWTRAAGARECKPCHCEVLAPIIEQMVTARRAEKVEAAAWAAAEDISTAAAAVGGSVAVEEAVRAVWQQTWMGQHGWPLRGAARERPEAAGSIDGGGPRERNRGAGESGDSGNAGAGGGAGEVDEMMASAGDDEGADSCAEDEGVAAVGSSADGGASAATDGTSGTGGGASSLHSDAKKKTRKRGRKTGRRSEHEAAKRAKTKAADEMD
jgi:hypothetical protein